MSSSAAAALPRPLNVSPLIRFSRWSLLTVGVLYGAYHHNRLSKKEAAWREAEAKLQVVRDAQLAVQKKLNYEAELKAIADLSTPTVKA